MNVFGRLGGVMEAGPGPVFALSMFQAGRRAGTYWLRMSYALGLTLVLGLVVGLSLWAGSAQQGLGLIELVQSLGPLVATVVAVFQFVLLPLAAAALTAPLLPAAREAGTIATLLTTPIPAWRIMVGLGLAAVVQVVVLALAGVPFLLAVAAMGGLPTVGVVAVTVLTLSSIVLGAVVGLVTTMGVTRGSLATTSAVIALVTLGVVAPVVVGTIEVTWGPTWRISPAWTMTFSPVGALVTTLGEMAQGGGGDHPGFRSVPGPMWVEATAVQWAVSVGLLAFGSWRLRAVMREPAVAGPARGKKKDGRGASREVGDRPMLWREVRQSAFRKAWRRWVVLGGIAALVGWLLYESRDDGPVSVALVIGGILVSMVSAATSASGSLSAEREGRTLDVLLATPIADAEIVWSKFAGSLRRMWLGPMLVVAGVIVGWTDDLGWLQGVGVVLMPLGPMVMLAALGVLVGVGARKASRVSTTGLLVGAGLWVGVPAMLGVASGLVGFAPPWVGEAMQRAVGGALVMNPAALPATGLLDDGPSIELFSIGQVSESQYLGVCVAVAAVYAGVGMLMLRVAAQRVRGLRAR